MRHREGWGSGEKALAWREAGFDEGNGRGSASGCRSEGLGDVDGWPSMFDGWETTWERAWDSGRDLVGYLEGVWGTISEVRQE